MSAWGRRWERFWFAPQAPLDLALCRILLLGYLCFYNWRGRSAETVTRLFGEQSWAPISFFRWLPEALPGPETFGALLGLYELCLALGCVGLFTRTACGAGFLLGLYVVGLGQNFGKVAHPEHVSLLLLGVLACSRAGDALSLDAWWRRRRGLAPAPAQSGEYRWPLRCAWLVMVLMFLGAGISKLRFGGLEWIFSDSFSNLLIVHHYRKPDLPGIGLWLAERRGLAQAAAFASVALELLAPLALLHRRLRLLLVPGLFLMQLGIALLMHTHTRSPNFVCYAFWIPWSAIGRRLRAR